LILRGTLKKPRPQQTELEMVIPTAGSNKSPPPSNNAAAAAVADGASRDPSTG
jgi:hypothetical protein